MDWTAFCWGTAFGVLACGWLFWGRLVFAVTVCFDEGEDIAPKLAFVIPVGVLLIGFTAGLITGCCNFYDHRDLAGVAATQVEGGK